MVAATQQQKSLLRITQYFAAPNLMISKSIICVHIASQEEALTRLLSGAIAAADAAWASAALGKVLLVIIGEVRPTRSLGRVAAIAAGRFRRVVASGGLLAIAAGLLIVLLNRHDRQSWLRHGPCTWECQCRWGEVQLLRSVLRSALLACAS